MRVDVHQHLWTEPLVAELRARDSLPFVRLEHGADVLHLLGEQPYLLDLEACSPGRREERLAEDGVDAAIVALSSPVGLERLPRLEAQRLIDAHLDGLGQLPKSFAAWGPLALEGLKAKDVDRLLDDRGCVGVSFPAGALAGAAAFAAAGPVLSRLESRGAPLFVHPGPGIDTIAARAPGAGEPLWWPALTSYVAQMQAAWLTLCALGRSEHPRLRVLFAMLAGGAPLLSERLAARGGPAVDLRDALIYYDTSSYGAVAIEAMASCVGEHQLLHGSDRPVLAPSPTGRDRRLMENADRLLEGRLG